MEYFPLNTSSVIAEFRANAGQVGGAYAGRRVLLLTTGDSRTTPLVYLPNPDDRMLLVAAGEPDWLADLRATPQATAESGAWTFPVEAEILDGETAAELLDRVAEADPGLATEAGTVVLLTSQFAGPPGGRPGDMLIAVHKGIRSELALIRAEIAAADAPNLILQLRINCLSLCQGLHHHHTAEDNGMFPALEAAHPELAEPLARLRREHAVVAELLERLQSLVSDGGGDPEAVLAELDRLAQELEAHLDYEEEQLIPLLNGV